MLRFFTFDKICQPHNMATDLLGERLRSIRLSRGLLMKDVAGNLCLDPAILSKIENGKRKPTFLQLELLAQLYGISKREILVEYYSEEIFQALKQTDFGNEAISKASKKIKQYKKVKINIKK